MANDDERSAFTGAFEKCVELVGHLGRAISTFSRFTPSEAGAVVAADTRGLRHLVLYPRPAYGHTRRRCLENYRRSPFADAMDMELVVADLDEPSWIRKLPPFERRGNALIGDTGKDDEGEQTGDDESDVARAL